MSCEFSYNEGEGQDYVLVELHQGALTVRVRLGASFFETDFKSKQNDIYFNNNNWHHVVLTRDSREVSSDYCQDGRQTGLRVKWLAS